MQIISCMCWLIAVSTLTVHTLSPVIQWETEHLYNKMDNCCLDVFQNTKENCCLQWMSYFTAACSFIDDPKHRPFTCDAEKVFSSVCQSLVFTNPRDISAVEDDRYFYVVTAKTPTWWDLQSDWTRGRDRWRTRGAVLKPVVRQFSLMVAKCLFYYHITFSSL